MRVNVGKTDQIIRIVVGVALLLWSFFGSQGVFWSIVLLVLGAIALYTGITKKCPLYKALGKSTTDGEL